MTKDTLFHYDKIGLLKPEVVKPNGYRYYSARQFFDMEMISTLQKAGSPLKEIQKYLSDYTKENFLKLLKRNYLSLEQKIQELMRQKSLLENTIHMTEYAVTEPLNMPKIVEYEEEYFIVTKTDLGTMEIEEMHVAEVPNIHDHVEYCNCHGYGEDYSIGSIISQESLLKGYFVEEYLYSKLHGYVEDERLYVKPAGKYVTMLHQGLYNGSDEAYKLLMDYIVKHKLEICGNAYEYEVAGYLSSGSPEEFIIQYSIQVF